MKINHPKGTQEEIEGRDPDHGGKSSKSFKCLYEAPPGLELPHSQSLGKCDIGKTP